MEIVLLIIGGFFLVVVLLLVTALISYVLDRMVVPHRYEWLIVLSHSEWKSTRQLRKEMKQIKGTSRGGMLIYLDLDELMNEDMVTMRIGETKEIMGSIFRFYEYRLTAKGTRKKLEVASLQKDGGYVEPLPSLNS